ncbi:MAG TPA: diacylglycerol kinase family protein [Planktothrix sp.]|jgi:diacylglycerol kinase family enzyme
MNLKRAVLIYNPVAGSTKKGIVDQIKSCFSDIDLQAWPTTAEPGSATKLAGEAVVQGYDLVIVCGGDETVRSVAVALRGTSTPMAAYPGGTGNLFARSYNPVPSPERFAKMVRSGEPQPIDMIELEYNTTEGKTVNGLFMVALGLGGVSDAISGASSRWKRLFGQLTYVVRVTLACLLPNKRRFLVSDSRNVTDVFVLNAAPPSMAKLSRGCSASDGYIDVVTLRCTNVISYLTAVAWLSIGRPESSKYYNRVRVKELTVKTASPVRPNVDGDPWAATNELRMRIVPSAVNIILSH